MVPDLPPKITIHLEPRSDGGLRVYSDDIPGLVLSHSDAAAVLDDIAPVLKKLLKHNLPTIAELVAEDSGAAMTYAWSRQRFAGRLGEWPHFNPYKRQRKVER
jgi:hypothetical protein